MKSVETALYRLGALIVITACFAICVPAVAQNKQAEHPDFKFSTLPFLSVKDGPRLSLLYVNSKLDRKAIVKYLSEISANEPSPPQAAGYHRKGLRPDNSGRHPSSRQAAG